MKTTRLLSRDQLARFYDGLGAGLDTQAFYEAAAMRDLVAHLEMRTSRAIVEFGCGTGRLAAELLANYVPPGATYLGLDVSRTMVELTKRRLSRWGGRVEVRQTDGAPHVEAADNTFDRFICTYVLDLLSDEEIRRVLDEAHRILRPGGLLGLGSLTNGPTPTSGLVTTIWRRLHQVSPWLVGGCRPITLSSFMPNSGWTVEYTNIVVRFGVPSDIVVARNVATPRST
ncbi:MAG: class I SAM-dependent methyltransferase [Alphaproteobacteria bacterium]|nr:class I SAM-dependent methyltransferase [Alphaproteobacteria bacterium]